MSLPQRWRAGQQHLFHQTPLGWVSITAPCIPVRSSWDLSLYDSQMTLPLTQSPSLSLPLFSLPPPPLPLVLPFSVHLARVLQESSGGVYLYEVRRTPSTRPQIRSFEVGVLGRPAPDTFVYLLVDKEPHLGGMDFSSARRGPQDVFEMSGEGWEGATREYICPGTSGLLLRTGSRNWVISCGRNVPLPCTHSVSLRFAYILNNGSLVRTPACPQPGSSSRRRPASNVLYIVHLAAGHTLLSSPDMVTRLSNWTITKQPSLGGGELIE